MAILSFGPLGQQRAPRSGVVNQDWTRNYVSTWQVVTDDPTDGPERVLQSLPFGLGNVYAEYDANLAILRQDRGAYITSLSAAEDTAANDGRQWIVTITYGPYQALQKPQDPTQEQPQISTSWAEFQRPATQDVVSGNPIVNSAGDLFDPPVMRDDSRPAFTIVRNEKTYDPSLCEDYRDTVNSGSFWVYSPKCVKCANITGQRVLNQDIGYYWQVSYQFQVNKDTWTYKALDQGFNTIIGGEKMKLMINGEPCSDPQLLNGSGGVLPPGSSGTFLPFDIYPPVDFSIFNFDSFFSTL